MRGSLRVILCIGVLVSAVTDAQAQRNRTQHKTPQARNRIAADTAGGTASTFAERRTQYAALLEVRQSTQKYLATLAPGTPEHAAAAKSLGEVEARIAALEKSLLALFAASGTGSGAATQPPPTDETAVEVRVEPAVRARVRAPSAADSEEPSPAPANADPPRATAPAPQATGGAQEEEEPTPTPTPAPVGIVEWVNNRIADKTVALINQGSNANQTETPAASEGSTSLVDQSSASDLVGVAFNLAGLSAGTNDDKDVSSAAVTTSAYALYAAFKGADPLDPAFYNQHGNWRKFSFTLGFDNEKDEDAGTTDRITLAGFKWLIINGREAPRMTGGCGLLNKGAAKNNAAQTCRILGALREAAGSFGRIDQEITGFLFRSKSVRASEFFRLAFREYLDDRTKMLNKRIDDAQKELGVQDEQLTADKQAEIKRIEALIAAGTAKNSDRRRLRLLQPRAVRAQEQIRVDRIQLDEIKELKEKNFELVLVPDKESEWTATEINFAREGFTNKVLQPADSFEKVRAVLTDEEKEALDKYVDARIDPFVKLRGETRKALEEIRSRPQFSFSFLGKRRKEGDDEYTSSLIYEKGLGTRTFATLNAGFKYKDSKLVGGDSRGGMVSGQLQFQVTPEESLISKSPIYLSISGNGEWLSGVKPKYKAQAKVKFPITDGIDFPISFTVANRTDLIDETDVRGQFGFTFDTSKLLRAFKFRLPSFASRPLAFAPLALPQTEP